ncbi:hypothetical protein KEM48_011827 [Puccinia striiformis f. sp. tritici PST-130]|nr:hypothetical protein KEM48_011827 [Puccinia striiformis f. sp. tritici PST-130]
MKNQDTLKSFGNCLKAVNESINSGRSCVVDNTNPTKQTRSSYILTAQKLGCQIRCVFFTAPIELAQHNNVYRASVQASRPLLPTLAFVSYSKNLEEPLVEEGFGELKKVQFVSKARRKNAYLGTNSYYNPLSPLAGSIPSILCEIFSV